MHPEGAHGSEIKQIIKYHESAHQSNAKQTIMLKVFDSPGCALFRYPFFFLNL